ncbi:membrane-targeted effector domain-containing toxin [Pseudomonas sp. SIMBA_077]
MLTSNTTPSSSETQQLLSLQQLFDYQKALKQLLDDLPKADKALLNLLEAQVQRSFPNHPLPIALDEVHYEEGIQLTLPVGSTLVEVPRPSTPNLLTSLFNNKPWGAEHFDAPNRVYRYVTKTIYDDVNPATPTLKRTVHLTTASTSAFELFVDGLIRRPDLAFVQQLDNFWGEVFAPNHSLTRAQWLAEQLSKALQAEAALRVADQTLDAQSKALLDLIIDAPLEQNRAHLPIDQRPAALFVSLKDQKQGTDMPLVGVFIVSSKTPMGGVSAKTDVGSVVLFTPDKGIDAFTSLQSLDRALRTRFADSQLSDGLLSTVHWQDQSRAQEYQKTNPALSYQLIQGSPFDHNVQALLTLQKQDIEHGWRQLPRYETSLKEINELFNRLTHIGPLVDIRSRMFDRSKRYIKANLPTWYQNASVDNRQALDTLMKAERMANKAFAKLLVTVNLPSLTTFARNELTRRLAADYPSKAIDPDRVNVVITHSLNPASLGGGIGPDHVPSVAEPTTRPSQTTRLSLTALALRNIDPWDLSFYKIFTGERTELSASFKDASGQVIVFNERYLKSLVQRSDVSTGYDQLLQKQLLTHGVALRKAWTEANRASMAGAVLIAHLDTESLLPHPEHRGYKWLQAIIESDTLSNRKTVDGHKIVASSLVIANSARTRNGYDLNEVLVISVEGRHPIPNVILYTPAAPDDQIFREFPHVQAMQLFLKQQWAESTDWQRYVTQRLSKAGQMALTERTTLIRELIFHTRSRVSNPFQTLFSFPLNTALHDTLYEQKVSTMRHNADHDSTSNAEVAEQSLWNKITFGSDLALELIPFLPITTTFKTLRSISKIFLMLKQMGNSTSTAKALWSITGARYRPRLAPKLEALLPMRPAPDLSGLEVQVRETDLTPTKSNLLQSKHSPQQYVLIRGKYYLTDVAQGNRFIYPAAPALQSLRHPLVKNSELGLWEAAPPLRLQGGMNTIEKGPLETTFRDYELSAADRAALPALNLATPGTFNLDTLNPSQGQDSWAARLHLFAIQTRLRRHARQYFKTFVAPPAPLILPARDLLPEPMLSHLLNQRKGLVFGEAHESGLTRRFLIDNMQALQRQGVQRMYMEFFNTDLHQDALDIFNGSLTTPMPAILRERLRWLEAYFRLSPNTSTYTQLIETAHAQGIRVMALDATVSSQFSAKDLIRPGDALTLSDQLDRVTLFNFFGFKKINYDQVSFGPHRWIALVGLGHCCTVQRIPGLADLTEGISLRVANRLPTLPLRINRDLGITVPSPAGTHPLRFTCDVLVCTPALKSSFSVQARVHSPTMFVITHSPSGQVDVYYMNAQHRRLTVPVMTDGSQVYLEHIAFGAVHNRRFIDLSALVDALVDELQMIEV